VQNLSKHNDSEKFAYASLGKPIATNALMAAMTAAGAIRVASSLSILSRMLPIPIILIGEKTSPTTTRAMVASSRGKIS